jgi:glycosyltransferase involved in cell wall biosynthesis
MILIISCVFPPEPVVSASLSKDIANELSVSEEVTVLHPKPTRPDGFEFSSEITDSDYKEITMDSYTCSKYSILGRLRESNSFGKKCANYIKKHHKDIKVIYLNAWPLFSQYKIVKTAKRWNIPCVTHVQDIYPEALSNKMPFLKFLINFFLLPIDRYILRNSTRVIAISNRMKNYISKTRHIDSKKIDVINNWQDEAAFLNLEQITTKNTSKLLTFMYLGNIGPVAGVEFLIESFIRSNTHYAKLVIAGSGTRKKYCENIANKATNIEFWSVPDGCVPAVQEQADVMLLPVKRNGAKSSIPSKLPAYMLSAKPIIACVDIESDTADAIQESGCGWVIEPDNKNMLTKKIEEVIKENKKHLGIMGEHGREYAMQHFSRKGNLKKITTLIQNIANDNLG